MPVVTKKVSGRRTLRFESLDEVQAEAERLADGRVKMLGNWSLAQIFKHLAAGLNSSLDGSTFKAPWYVKMMAPFLKNSFLNKTLPPGFSIPPVAEAQFLPQDNAETAASLEELRAAIKRVKSTQDRALHPLFGALKPEDSDRFHMRHAELHLGFAIPEPANA